MERGHVSESASISTGIAARYATAVFELAKDGKGLDALEQDIDTLDAALSESADFRALIHSPVYSRDAQGKAVSAIAEKMGLGEILANTLKLMASKRRLFVLPHLVSALRGLIADEKGRGHRRGACRDRPDRRTEGSAGQDPERVGRQRRENECHRR